MTTTDESRTVAELISGERIAMLTTTAPQGTLTSRPMALQEVEFDGDLWFFAERSSRKVGHLDAHPEVNVTVGSGATWVSLTGRAVVVEDSAKKHELWNSGVAAWFPDGPDDAAIVLIKVEGSSAEYWNTPGGRIATAFSFARAKVTGQPYDGGENETVRL